MKSLYEILLPTQTEEEVKNLFAKFFYLKLDTKNYIDLYTPQILFEFKFDDKIKNLPTLAKCFAQTLYYIRRLKYGREIRTPSHQICIVTKNFAAISQTENFSNFYLKSKAKNFDWDLAPSSPCKKLVNALADFDFLKNLHVYDFSVAEDLKIFVEKIKNSLSAQLSLFADKKIIDEYNFYEIFTYWQKLFGDDVENGKKSSEYFITDIEQGRSTLLDKSIIFRMSGGEIVEKKIKIDEYKHFWSVYEKISNPREIISIRQKMDRMTEIDLRRRTGEFFTPINFAEKAVEYLARTVGENWYKSGKFRLWDMAAGTGNLEFALPAEALKFCYISTLLEDDANYCRKIFPDATVFQYDYLNDDVQFFEDSLFEKYSTRIMPKNLVDDLKNPEIKWIIFINPPYATASTFERDKNRKDKNGVSMTKIRALMNKENLGEVSRELFSQFLYRISIEFFNRQAWLGIFSKIKYISSNNDQKLRDKVFQYEYERGFIFSSENFQGCKGKFPVGFLIWNLNKKIPLNEQNISTDIYNFNIEKYAEKIFYSSNRKDFLNKWIKRPPAIKKFPPLSGGLNVADKNKDRRDRISENFLASLMCVANDFTHQNYTSILSGPYVSAGAMSITPENFEQSMVVHMVRQLPKATWLNDRDQFMQPTKELSREFICDAVIWSLFAPSNQTVSLRNVEYEGEIYRMPNNLFPFMLEELRAWKISDADIRMQIFMATDDRFAAKWIQKNYADISEESRAVLRKARIIYKKFYEELTDLDLKKYKIADWDAGWYQIRMSSGASIDLTELSEKLLPQIYDLGFLRDEVKYF